MGMNKKKKKIFFEKKFKMADSKKLLSTSPKAEQFPPKFHGLVLGLVGLIDAKGTYMVVRLSDVSSKTGKKCSFCVLSCFCPYVR